MLETPVTTSAKPTSGGKSVVIVGGGYGGGTLAHKLKGTKGITVTLINPSEFALYKPASLRAAVWAGDWSSNTLVPLKDAADKLVLGSAASVDDVAKTVTLADGQVVKYDTLVLATGSKTSGPGWVPLGSTLTDAKALFESTKAEFEKAKKIVIIGGGATGIELAGEAAEAHPDAKVTLVHSGKELMELSSAEKNVLNKKYHRVLNQEVAKYKIDVKTSSRIEGLSRADFDDRFMLTGERTLTIQGGTETIEADLVCWCVGVTPVSSMYPAAWVNESGRVKVDEFLRVQGKEDVFCLGDVSDVKEFKGIFALDGAVSAVAINVKRAGTTKGMKKYKPVTAAHSFIAMGRKGGVAQAPFFGGMVMGPFMIKRMKGPDQFAWKAWKLIGAGKKQTWTVREKAAETKTA